MKLNLALLSLWLGGFFLGLAAGGCHIERKPDDAMPALELQAQCSTGAFDMGAFGYMYVPCAGGELEVHDRVVVCRCQVEDDGPVLEHR